MKKTLIILIFISFNAKIIYAGIFIGGTDDKADVARLYNENRYQEIVEILESKETESLTAAELYYLGLSYSQIKKIKEAAASLKRCVEVDSLNKGYLLSYSRVLNQLGKINDAIGTYNRILNIDSTNIPALYDLGMIMVNQKDFFQAKDIFTKLTQINNDDFLSTYLLALASYKIAVTKNDTSLVQKLIYRAIRLNQEYIPAYELAATFCLNEEAYGPAFTHYLHLSKLNSLNAEYFYRAGFCFEKIKNYDGAIGLINKAIKRDSTVSHYFSHLGYSYYMVKEYDSSLVAYSHAAELDSENPSSFLNLGLVYEKLDSLESAAKAYEKALQLYPYSKIIFTTEQLEAVNYRLKNFEQTKMLCEQALVIAPNSAVSLFYLACSLDALDKADKAIEIYKQASVELKKDNNYQNEFEYVEKRIEEISAKAKEKKFWEGKIK